MPLAFHLMHRLVDGRVLVHDDAERRIYAEAVLRLGEGCGLFSFGLPDSHGHVGLTCDRSTAGGFSQRLGASLRKSLRLPVAFSPVHVVEVKDQSHLRNVFLYMLGQAEHHGIEADRLLEATALPDLLGLRVTGSYLAGRVRALLPRVRREDLLGKYGLSELEPHDDLGELADAAASSVAMATLEGKAAEITAARCAAVHFARRAGAATASIAALLDLSPQAIRKLTHRRPDERLLKAIGLQLGLRLARPRPPEGF